MVLAAAMLVEVGMLQAVVVEEKLAAAMPRCSRWVVIGMCAVAAVVAMLGTSALAFGQE